MESSIKSTHAFNLEKLKNSFNNILQLIDEINHIKLHANKKLNKLRDAYFKLIENNNKKVFLFCLDSFYFQYKSFQLEYDNLEKGLAFINNRMYCDYYKLYHMIVDTIKTNKIDDSDIYELREYIQYKDLEPFLEYRLEDIKDIHHNILHIVQILFSQYSERHMSIQNYNDHHKIGFSISNFINTLQYENSILNEQVNLYINYMAFFHISQKKYLARMYSKFDNFYKEVESNIKTNINFSIDDINAEPIIEGDNEFEAKLNTTESINGMVNELIEAGETVVIKKNISLSDEIQIMDEIQNKFGSNDSINKIGANSDANVGLNIDIDTTSMKGTTNTQTEKKNSTKKENPTKK